MIRLAVRVRLQQADLVLAELLELVPAGVEEVAIADDVVEYAVYGAPGEVPALPELKAVAGGALVELRTEEIADDWDQGWRKFHKPLVLEGRLTVRPPWEPVGATTVDLVIDPGRAFGTGAHPTTRLCLELMLDLEPTGPFVDLGCGSGVLAIAAARLGWAPVRALDYDQAAVDATSENARLNRVEIEVTRHDLRTDPPPGGRTIAANLLAPLLLSLASRLEQAPEQLIASGLLEEEADGVVNAFAASGLEEVARRRAGEWVALLLARSQRGCIRAPAPGLSSPR